MNVEQKILTEDDIEFNNRMSAMKLRFILERAKLINEDKEKETRLEECHCVLCYYEVGGILAMQAFHHTNCSVCNKEMIFSSSHINRTCTSCAKEKGLCKGCGSSIDFSEEVLVPVRRLYD